MGSTIHLLLLHTPCLSISSFSPLPPLQLGLLLGLETMDTEDMEDTEDITTPTPSVPRRWRPSPGTSASWSLRSPAPQRQKHLPRSLGMRRENVRRLSSASMDTGTGLVTLATMAIMARGLPRLLMAMLLLSVRRRPRRSASRCLSRRRYPRI